MLQLGVHLDLKGQCLCRDNNVADTGEKDRCKTFFVIIFLKAESHWSIYLS